MLFFLLFSLTAIAVLPILWLVYGFLYFRKQHPIPLTLVIVTVVAAIPILITYFFNIQPSRLRAKQVSSFANMQTIRCRLDKYAETHGRYPPDLQTMNHEFSHTDLTDGWGTPYLYQSRNESYILVALGSDGKEDSIDYWIVRVSYEELVDVTGIWTADQVASDKGWHRTASK